MNNERDRAPIEIFQPLKEQQATDCIAPEAAGDFFNGQPKKQMIKISHAFSKRLINTVRDAAQIYKVEIRV